MKIKLLVLSLFGFFFTSTTQAQEQLMAERNAMFSVSYGVMNSLVSFNKEDDVEITGFSRNIKSKQTNPLSLTFEYALRNQLNVGINFSYFSFSFVESLQTAGPDVYVNTSKGNFFALHLRGLRYLAHREKFMVYLFGHAGIRTSTATNTSSGSNPNIYSSLGNFEFTRKGFLSGSFEAGVGTKIGITRSLGINIEAGAITSVLQFGMFYRILEPSRKTKDVYGW